MTSKLQKKIKPEQAKSIADIEKLIGKEIPQIKDYVASMIFGAKIEGSNVVELGLHDCGLTSLPESIGNLTSLQKLYIEFNKLTTLPNSLANLQSLKELKLDSNNYTTFPTSITSLNSLQELKLNNTSIIQLPESIGNLQSLKELSLFNNKITKIPESIGELSSLQKLDLWDNQLTTIPESFSKLQKLQTLDLSSNNLINLPESISSLSSLQELKLKNNKLKTLPDSFSQLKNLRIVELENNNWTGEWADIAKNDIPTILKLSRKLNGMYIFISHAWVDQERYQVVELKNYLENECLKREDELNMNIIHDVYVCEEDVIDDIWDFMTEFVPKSHILLFIASNDSIASEACRYELFLASKYDLEILPIKGEDINWEDLSKIALVDRNLQYQGNLDLSNPKERFEFGGNKIYERLSEYIKAYESILKKRKKGTDGIEETKKNILEIINSIEFRELIKVNFEGFNNLFQALNKKQFTNLEYFWRLGEILRK